MKKKYKMTKISMNFNGRKIYRIKALRDFGDVKKGDLGGWIEKEENLSHEGNCWLYHDAMVYDDAKVFGDAKILDRARVFGNADVRSCVNIYDDSIVFGDAQVYGDVIIKEAAQVYHNAIILDKAVVCGDSQIGGNAIIFNDAIVRGSTSINSSTYIANCAYILSDDDYITFSKIGSRNDTTTFYNTKDEGIYVKCGCFNGTLDKFKDAVIKTHGDNKYAKEYLAAIELAKIKLSK